MEIPSTFVDSAFSMDIMRDPVSTPQGHTFEREAISEWVRVKGTCPLTREALSLGDLTPNRALRYVVAPALLSSESACRRSALPARHVARTHEARARARVSAARPLKSS